MSETADALESLIRSEGWRVLGEMARAEWATRERQGRKTALNDDNDKRALDKLRQITAAQEAVEWVLALPSQEIARLRRVESPTDRGAALSERRGIAPHPAIQGMSRRGSL